jgi:hypothetical protein
MRRSQCGQLSTRHVRDNHQVDVRCKISNVSSSFIYLYHDTTINCNMVFKLYVHFEGPPKYVFIFRGSPDDTVDLVKNAFVSTYTALHPHFSSLRPDDLYLQHNSTASIISDATRVGDVCESGDDLLALVSAQAQSPITGDPPAIGTEILRESAIPISSRTQLPVHTSSADSKGFQARSEESHAGGSAATRAARATKDISDQHSEKHPSGSKASTGPARCQREETAAPAKLPTKVVSQTPQAKGNSAAFRATSSVGRGVPQDAQGGPIEAGKQDGSADGKGSQTGNGSEKEGSARTYESPLLKPFMAQAKIAEERKHFRAAANIYHKVCPLLALTPSTHGLVSDSKRMPR